MESDYYYGEHEILWSLGVNMNSLIIMESMIVSIDKIMISSVN